MMEGESSVAVPAGGTFPTCRLWTLAILSSCRSYWAGAESAALTAIHARLLDLLCFLGERNRQGVADWNSAPRRPNAREVI